MAKKPQKPKHEPEVTKAITMGRPSIYTPELATQICERLADGESLRQICSDPAMPGRSTVRDWLRNNDAFRAEYARAREDQATGLFDLMLDIAEGAAPVNLTALEVKYRTEGNIDIATVADPVARDRLRIDTIRWAASKLPARVYGDKIPADVNVKKD